MDKEYMRVALQEAKKAYKKGEIPVGAIIVKEGKIIGRGHNLKETTKDPTQHAEIVAIRDAVKSLGDWRLNGATMYVTKEPCVMCAGAIIEARIERVVLGVIDREKGAFGGKFNILNILGAKIIVEKEVLSQESKKLLLSFFENLRRGG
ncbi:MAG TPA: nucleoside deaminase [Firmicutes bacterium]|nr:nucleoside deaminase [Bacillota bacterium]